MKQRFSLYMTVSFLLGILVILCPVWYVYVSSAVWGGWLFLTLLRQQKKWNRKKKTGRLWTLCGSVICLCFFLQGVWLAREQQHVIHNTESYLEQNQQVEVVGKLWQKEEKNGSIIYYLKDSFFLTEREPISCNTVMVYVKSDHCSVGDFIRVKGVAQIFEQRRNQGTFCAKSYYYSKNILCAVTGEKGVVVNKESFLWKEKLFRFRNKMVKVYESMLPGEDAGVLAVMSLGDKTLLDPEVKSLYQSSGISHVLAISGLHISLLGKQGYLALRKKGMSYLLAGMLSGVFLLVFVVMSGVGISSGRALFMFWCVLVGNTLGMCYDSLSALGIVAVLQLWENPLAITNSGMQFSYCAVIAVVVCSKFFASEKNAKRKTDCGLILRWKTKIYTEGKNNLQTSFYIQLVTLPLVMYYYYEIPLYGILINGFILPFLGPLLVSGLLGGVFGVFSLEGSWLLQRGFYKVAEILLWGTGKLLLWNRMVCSWFEKLPWSTIVTGCPGIWQILLYYALLFIVLWYAYDQKKNGEKKGIFKKSWAFACLLVGILLLCVLPASQSALQINFLDVGQGDGICVQTKKNHVYFIDGGSTSKKELGEWCLIPFLKYHGITSIDGWFVSHGDLDHISGLLEVLDSEVEVKRLFLSEYMNRDDNWMHLVEKAKSRRTHIYYLTPNQKVKDKEITWTCLYPFEAESSRNQNSLVMLLETKGMRGLFAGDLSIDEEGELIQKYGKIPVNLFKANHHGSDHSNGSLFLEAISPDVTVISCDKKNSYGHPGKETIQRLKSINSRIFYTMYGGQVSVTVKGGTLRVSHPMENSSIATLQENR